MFFPDEALVEMWAPSPRLRHGLSWPAMSGSPDLAIRIVATADRVPIAAEEDRRDLGGCGGALPGGRISQHGQAQRRYQVIVAARLHGPAPASRWIAALARAR